MVRVIARGEPMLGEGYEAIRPLRGTQFPDGIWGCDGQLLYSLVRAHRPGHVLEVGTGAGLSTAYLAAACRDNGEGEVTTVDTVQRSLCVVPAALRELVDFQRGNALELLPGRPVDFLFVDGPPEAGFVEGLLQRLRTHLAPGATVVVHDYKLDSNILPLASRVLEAPGTPWSAHPEHCGIAFWEGVAEGANPLNCIPYYENVCASLGMHGRLDENPIVASSSALGESIWEPEGRILYALVRHHQPRLIVEVGTRGAYSTSWMAAAMNANGFGRIVTIDHAEYPRDHIPEPLRERIEFVVADGLQAEIPDEPIGMLLEDGAHTYEFTRAVLERYDPNRRIPVVCVHDVCQFPPLFRAGNDALGFEGVALSFVSGAPGIGIWRR
jgi:predicted O-methyltransferase YrrM